MKPKNFLMLMMCGLLLTAVGCSQPEQAVEADAAAEGETVAQEAIHTEDFESEVRHDVVYTCDCGPDCACGSVSTEAGTCDCGSELAANHVVKVEGHEALVCTCGNECDCEISAEDETKCSCGSDLRRVSLEGTGLYFCNCGGSCTCNHVSAEPGTCACGMDLKTV